MSALSPPPSRPQTSGSMSGLGEHLNAEPALDFFASLTASLAQVQRRTKNIEQNAEEIAKLKLKVSTISGVSEGQVELAEQASEAALQRALAQVEDRMATMLTARMEEVRVQVNTRIDHMGAQMLEELATRDRLALQRPHVQQPPAAPSPSPLAPTPTQPTRSSTPRDALVESPQPVAEQQDSSSTPQDMFSQVLDKAAENVFLHHRLAALEHRAQEKHRQAQAERSSNSRRIRDLECVIKELVENNGKLKSSHTLGLDSKPEPKSSRPRSKQVTPESLALHLADMRALPQRTEAAVCIQRGYRVHLADRNWPTLDYRSWQQEEEPVVLQVEVEAVETVTSGETDPSVLAKLNAHSASLVAIQTQLNSITNVSQQDRSMVRGLRDEMLDYIDKSDEMAEELGVMRTELTEEHSEALREGLAGVFVKLEEQAQAQSQALEQHSGDSAMHSAGSDLISTQQLADEMKGLSDKVARAWDKLEEILSIGTGVRSSSHEDSSSSLARHKEVSEKIVHLQKVIQQVNEVAEESEKSARLACKRVDDMRRGTAGGLEAEMKSVGLRVTDLFAGHQTLSTSVQQLQRQTHKLMDKPKGHELMDKLEAKLSLMWRAKADKEEVDKAISRAVETVLLKIPEDPDEHSQGPILATWSCLGCGKRHNPLSSNLEDSCPKGFEGGKSKGADLLFGKLRSSDTHDRVPPLLASVAASSTTSSIPPVPSPGSATTRSPRAPLRGGGRMTRGPSGFSTQRASSPRVSTLKGASHPLTATQPLPAAVVEEQLHESPRVGPKGSKRTGGLDGGAAGGFQMNPKSPRLKPMRERQE